MNKKAFHIVLPACLSLVVFIMTAYTACKKPEEKPDPCRSVLCENKGVCAEGICQCPRGYTGEHCELKWFSKFEGNWLVFDSSADGYKSYYVKVKPSVTDPAALVIDSFWVYKVNNIVAELDDERSFTFKKEQNVYPGYQQNYVLKEGAAKIDSAFDIAGTFIITNPGDTDIVHFFTMKR